MTNVLKQTLEENGLTVNSIEVSPRGIITIALKMGDFKSIGKEHEVFRKLGIRVKGLPFSMESMRFGNENREVKYPRL